MPNHSFFARLSKRLDKHRWQVNLIGVLVLMCAIVQFVPGGTKPYSSEKLAEVTAKRKKEAADNKFVQQVDRAELSCLSRIRDRLNDPDSFKFIDYKHVFLDQEVYIIEIQFSAKNGFGGRVRNTARCKGRFS